MGDDIVVLLLVGVATFVVLVAVRWWLEVRSRNGSDLVLSDVVARFVNNIRADAGLSPIDSDSPVFPLVYGLIVCDRVVTNSVDAVMLKPTDCNLIVEAVAARLDVSPDQMLDRLILEDGSDYSAEQRKAFGKLIDRSMYRPSQHTVAGGICFSMGDPRTSQTEQSNNPAS